MTNEYREIVFTYGNENSGRYVNFVQVQDYDAMRMVEEEYGDERAKMTEEEKMQAYVDSESIRIEEEYGDEVDDEFIKKAREAYLSS